MSSFICGDCLEYMRKTPDKFYELAIVDPPYGDGLRAKDAANGIEMLMPAERERERVGLAGNLTSTSEQRTVGRTGGAWAAKYGKKS